MRTPFFFAFRALLNSRSSYWDVVKPATAVVFVHNMLQRQKDPEEICAELTQVGVFFLILHFAF